MNGLSKYYIKKLIGCFAEELTATETARKLKINRNTVNKYYRMVREAVADYQSVQHGRHGLGLPKQAIPFYWHKSTGLSLVYHPESTLFWVNVFNQNVFLEQTQSEDERWKELVRQIEASGNDVGIERNNYLTQNFYSYAKDQLTKFYGVKEPYTFMYLKELEFRFNNRDKDLSKFLLRILPHHSVEWVKTTKFRR